MLAKFSELGRTPGEIGLLAPLQGRLTSAQHLTEDHYSRQNPDPRPLRLGMMYAATPVPVAGGRPRPRPVKRSHFRRRALQT